MRQAPAGGYDAATRRGLQLFYSLEYDQAVVEFERAAALRPTDPMAVNRVLQAELFRELYRNNALDTTLYAQDDFLQGKPLALDKRYQERVQKLWTRALELAEERLRTDGEDVDALYSRGVTKGLRSTYVALVEKSFVTALKTALSSREDHEKVLRKNPQYVDAKLAVGIHQYIVGSLPFYLRAAAALVGLGGSKERGLRMLHEVSAAGRDTSVDAMVALALFYRREGKYADALAIARRLEREHPQNFLFALEEANLLKDAGRGPEAIAAYRKVLEQAEKGAFPNPRAELAWYGLAECLRGQRQFQEAVEAYEAALVVPGIHPEIRQRALLGAGEMYDVLQRRELALSKYKAAIASGEPDSPVARRARRSLKNPYRMR